MKCTRRRVCKDAKHDGQLGRVLFMRQQISNIEEIANGRTSFWLSSPSSNFRREFVAAFAVAVAVAVADTFRMGGDHESYKAL